MKKLNEKITYLEFENINIAERSRALNKLDIMDQINYINSCLKAGETLNSIEKDKHINKTLIRKRFLEKKNYVYDRKSKQYIPLHVFENDSEDILKPIPEDAAAKAPDPIAADPERIALLENAIDGHELRIREIENIIGGYITTAPLITISSGEFIGELKTRSFKVYENILNDFIDFCSENKSFRQQDLTTQALHEFMEKYKGKR